MASGIFQTLPEELLGEIEQALPFQDRLQLSAVDSRLRRCLTPGLYTTIRFSNRLNEQRAVADIIAKYGHYARGLALTLDLAVPEPEEGTDETEEPMTTTADADWSAPGLPNFTLDLLTGKTLPGISSFSIRFLADPGGEVGFRGAELDYDDWVGMWGPVAPEDPAEELAEEEGLAGWRQCLAATWRALADNPGTIRHLSVPNLVLAPSSAWQTPAWAAFMGRLESLSLGMWDVKGILDDGEYECQDVKDMLDRHWYCHATALRRLEIVAGPGNLYATAVWGDETVSFEDGAPKLPSLKELRIVNCLLSDAMARLIAARAVMGLRRIELVGCASGAPYVDAQDPCWRSFFLSIPTFIDLRQGQRWIAAVESGRASGRSLLEIEDFVLLHGRKTAELWKMGEAETYMLEKKGIISGVGLGLLELENLQKVRNGRERIRQLRCLGRDVNENEYIFPYAFKDLRSGSIEFCVHPAVMRAAGARDAAAFKVLMDFVKTRRELG